MANILHKGQRLKKAITHLGLKKTVLAKRLKTSRVTLDKHINDGNFCAEHLLIVDKIIEQSE